MHPQNSPRKKKQQLQITSSPQTSRTVTTSSHDNNNEKEEEEHQQLEKQFFEKSLSNTGGSRTQVNRQKVVEEETTTTPEKTSEENNNNNNNRALVPVPTPPKHIPMNQSSSLQQYQHQQQHQQQSPTTINSLGTRLAQKTDIGFDTKVPQLLPVLSCWPARPTPARSVREVNNNNNTTTNTSSIHHHNAVDHRATRSLLKQQAEYKKEMGLLEASNEQQQYQEEDQEEHINNNNNNNINNKSVRKAARSTIARITGDNNNNNNDDGTNVEGNTIQINNNDSLEPLGPLTLTSSKPALAMQMEKELSLKLSVKQSLPEKVAIITQLLRKLSKMFPSYQSVLHSTIEVIEGFSGELSSTLHNVENYATVSIRQFQDRQLQKVYNNLRKEAESRIALEAQVQTLKQFIAKKIHERDDDVKKAHTQTMKLIQQVSEESHLEEELKRLRTHVGSLASEAANLKIQLHRYEVRSMKAGRGLITTTTGSGDSDESDESDDDESDENNENFETTKTTRKKQKKLKQQQQQEKATTTKTKKEKKVPNFPARDLADAVPSNFIEATRGEVDQYRIRMQREIVDVASGTHSAFRLKISHLQHQLEDLQEQLKESEEQRQMVERQAHERRFVRGTLPIQIFNAMKRDRLVSQDEELFPGNSTTTNTANNNSNSNNNNSNNENNNNNNNDNNLQNFAQSARRAELENIARCYTPRPFFPFDVQTHLGINLGERSRDVAEHLSVLAVDLQEELMLIRKQNRKIYASARWMSEQDLDEIFDEEEQEIFNTSSSSGSNNNTANTTTGNNSNKQQKQQAPPPIINRGRSLTTGDGASGMIQTCIESEWPSLPHFLRTDLTLGVFNKNWSATQTIEFSVKILNLIPECFDRARKLKDKYMIAPPSDVLYERRRSPLIPQLDATTKQMLSRDGGYVPIGYAVSVAIRHLCEIDLLEELTGMTYTVIRHSSSSSSGDGDGEDNNTNTEEDKNDIFSKSSTMSKSMSMFNQSTGSSASSSAVRGAGGILPGSFAQLLPDSHPQVSRTGLLRHAANVAYNWWDALHRYKDQFPICDFTMKIVDGSIDISSFGYFKKMIQGIEVDMIERAAPLSGNTGDSTTTTTSNAPSSALSMMMNNNSNSSSNTFSSQAAIPWVTFAKILSWRFAGAPLPSMSRQAVFAAAKTVDKLGYSYADRLPITKMLSCESLEISAIIDGESEQGRSFLNSVDGNNETEKEKEKQEKEKQQEKDPLDITDTNTNIANINSTTENISSSPTTNTTNNSNLKVGFSESTNHDASSTNMSPQLRPRSHSIADGFLAASLQPTTTGGKSTNANDISSFQQSIIGGGGNKSQSNNNPNTFGKSLNAKNINRTNFVGNSSSQRQLTATFGNYTIIATPLSEQEFDKKQQKGHPSRSTSTGTIPTSFFPTTFSNITNMSQTTNNSQRISLLDSSSSTSNTIQKQKQQKLISISPLVNCLLKMTIESIVELFDQIVNKIEPSVHQSSFEEGVAVLSGSEALRLAKEIDAAFLASRENDFNRDAEKAKKAAASSTTPTTAEQNSSPFTKNSNINNNNNTEKLTMLTAAQMSKQGSCTLCFSAVLVVQEALSKCQPLDEAVHKPRLLGNSKNDLMMDANSKELARAARNRRRKQRRGSMVGSGSSSSSPRKNSPHNNNNSPDSNENSMIGRSKTLSVKGDSTPPRTTSSSSPGNRRRSQSSLPTSSHSNNRLRKNSSSGFFGEASSSEFLHEVLHSPDQVHEDTISSTTGGENINNTNVNNNNEDQFFGSENENSFYERLWVEWHEFVVNLRKTPPQMLPGVNA